MKGWLLIALLSLTLPVRAVAQSWEDYDYENLQFRGIGLDFGVVVPTEIRPAMSFGVRADMGLVGPHVRVSPSVRFWSSTMRESEVERLAQQFVRTCEKRAPGSCPATLDLGEIRRSDLELSADAHYLFGAPGGFAPYAGAGLSLHLLNGRGEFINDTFVEDLLDTVSPGLNLLGGLNLPLGSSLQLMTEGRLVITSDVQYGNVVLGGTWTLPSPPTAANPQQRREDGR